ncbi:YlcI/YnfO family protein [Pectobacterium cacticida]|uniref:YlcI/YnfO family protein n=1 Tax=Pectobacterium cacticida TaxID=69221 RepID=UPI0039882580
MQDKNTKSAFERSGSTKKNIRFEDDLLKQINDVAGPGNFSSWVKEACREKLYKLAIKPKR